MAKFLTLLLKELTCSLQTLKSCLVVTSSLQMGRLGEVKEGAHDQ